MAKSKAQKQLEALDRKRALYSDKARRFRNTQFGSSDYTQYEHRFGTEAAQRWAEEEKRIFLKFCKEAQIDTHGNRLGDI